MLFLDFLARKGYDCTVITSHSKTDSFGRKVFEELQLGTGFVSRQFDYVVGTFTDEHKDNNKLKSTPTTNLVSRITFADGRTIEYEYDEEERITRVIDSLDGEWVYTYDALGQLLTEQHKAVGAESYTTVNAMTYDNYGNILTKNGATYTYDSVWKDKLTKVGDTEIDYDDQGNPTSCLSHTLTWEKGRQLKSIEKVENGVTKPFASFTYNANGIRTSKTVNGVKHAYVLDGTKILSESVGTLITYVHYDNEGSICGITYNGTPYYFLKNLQGDIIAITDRDGEVVARYTYDAWGKVLSVTDKNGVAITAPNNIANINPYRYRGYYYDTETGLYYLQSRYYDPETGRFINADEICNLTNFYGVQFLNLYSYCINSPILFSDAKGEYPILVGAGLQVSLSLSFGGLSVGAGFELIYFWTGNFNTKKSSRFLLYFYFEPINFSFSQLKSSININWYYKRMKFNPKNLFSKPSFNAAICILTIFADHRQKFSYMDYERRFDTSSIAFCGINTFKSWSNIFKVYGVGKYWGLSGAGTTRSVSSYWMVLDVGSSMKELMNSIKKQGVANA